MLKTYPQKHFTWKIRNIIFNKKGPFGTIGLSRVLAAIVLQIYEIKYSQHCNGTTCAIYFAQYLGLL